MTLKMDIPAMEAFLAAEFPQIDSQFTIEALSEANLTVSLNVQDQHLRPGGTVSGPSMFALADVAMYMAVLARIGPVALAVTTNCSIDFMRKPAAGLKLLAETRVLKLGRQLAVGDVLIHNGDPAKPVAHANLTYAIPPGSQNRA